MTDGQRTVEDTCAYEDCERTVSEDERCYWHREVDGKCPEEDLELDEGFPADLSGAYLAKAELSELTPEEPPFTETPSINLTDADLRQANLKDADLAGSSLANACLGGAKLANANFEGANLSMANLYCASFTNADLFGATLIDANLTDANLADSDMTEADCSGADFSRTNLTNVRLLDSELTDVIFENADLTQAELSPADLTRADLSFADLSEADLRSADLTEASLYEADLTKSSLYEADLTKADLSGGPLTDKPDLTEAKFSFANLTSANIRRADLTNANLRDATLDNITLYDTDLSGVEIDEGTTARPPSGHELRADEDATPNNLPEPIATRLRLFTRSNSDADDLQRAEQQYRRIERLYRENDLRPNWLSELEIQEKHARRKRALAEGDYTGWLRRAFSRWVLGYGLLVKPIIGVMLAVILVSTLLYPVFGFADGTLAPGPASGTVAYDSVPPSLSWETLETLGRSLYFSTITFSTLGYGHLSPTGWARGLATVESFLGAVLMAYLVSVLSRRAIR